MDIFRTHGIKQTKNREIIYSRLNELNAPISADSLYALLLDNHSINLATVYRNLNTFVEHGIAEKHIRQDGISYFNVIKHKHNHYLICESCKSQFELDDCPIDKYFFQEMQNKGFLITGHNVEIYGLCKDCQKSEN